MIIKENITVYICQHCKKRYFKKNACEKHETICYSNPENFRACSGCDHLEETTNKVFFDAWDGESSRTFKAFRCKKLDKMLYPFKVEAKGIIGKYPESFEEQEPMPKKCEHLTIGGLLMGDLQSNDLFGNKTY
jgi:hypothetical protein